MLHTRRWPTATRWRPQLLPTRSLDRASWPSVRGCARRAMRSRRNRLGQAGTLQAEIIADLREILDLLANRRRDELARLAEKLPEVEGVLSALMRRQRDLRGRMEDEAARPAADEDRSHAEWKSLSRQQGQLQAEADDLASLLVQLLAERPAESIRAAAGHMAQASQAAGAVEPEFAVRHAKDAEEALDEAARRLAEHLARVEADAAARNWPGSKPRSGRFTSGNKKQPTKQSGSMPRHASP